MELFSPGKASLKIFRIRPLDGFRPGKQTLQEDAIAKISLDRTRWRTRIAGPLLGRSERHRQAGVQVPLWHICHQHHCLFHHWLFSYLSGQARGHGPGVEVSGAHRICWRLQYLLNV